MRKIFYLLIILSVFSCQKKNQTAETITVADSIPSESEKIADTLIEEEEPVVKTSELSYLVPSNFVIFKELRGDLNKDGAEDCVLIIKDTDKENIIVDEYKGKLDQNRRGIIIAFKKGDGYEPVVRNYSCFSSENEDGGVYYAPELWIEINEKGNLEIKYAHGRYGHLGYIFRYQNNAFEMIGYFAESNRGPVGLHKRNINFSTKKMQVSRNVNEDCESGDEEWEETWENIKNKKLIRLSDIEDFDNISLESYYEEQED